MSNKSENATRGQCDVESSCPPFSANDFDPRANWTALDCICGDAKLAGKAVQFDPHSCGFVQCDEDGVGL